jgi:hypothetical protein
MSLLKTLAPENTVAKEKKAEFIHSQRNHRLQSPPTDKPRIFNSSVTPLLNIVHFSMYTWRYVGHVLYTPPRVNPPTAIACSRYVKSFPATRINLPWNISTTLEVSQLLRTLLKAVAVENAVARINGRVRSHSHSTQQKKAKEPWYNTVARNESKLSQHILIKPFFRHHPLSCMPPSPPTQALAEPSNYNSMFTSRQAILKCT